MPAISIFHFWCKKVNQCLFDIFIFGFFVSKNFVRTKTSDNRRVLSPGNMVDATEFPSLVLQLFDESPKQHVAWHFHDAVWWPFYRTSPASFLGLLSFSHSVADSTPNWAFLSVLTAHMYWTSNVPPYTQHSLIQSQIWFRGWRARFSGFTRCSFPCYVFVGNPLFITSYPVQDGLDFVPSKQRCAYDD